MNIKFQSSLIAYGGILIMYDILLVGAGPNGIYVFDRLKQNFPSKKIGIIEKSDVVNSLSQYPNINWHSPSNELELNGFKNNWSEKHPKTEEVITYYKKFFYLKKNNLIKDEVISIKNYKDHTFLSCKRNNFKCKILVLATGIFDNKNYITEETLPPYVSYLFPCSALNGKKIILIGGGNSAIDFVLSFLSNNKLFWIIKSEKYTEPCPDLNFKNHVAKFKDNLSFYNQSSIVKFNSDRSVKTSCGKIISNIDHCFLLTGYNGMTPLLVNAGASFKNKFPTLNRFNETSLKNIYVAGALSSTYNNPIYIHNGNPEIIDQMILDINEKL